MCITFFQTDPDRLLFLFNREESADRETKALHYWEDDPNILAGRDLKKGGTWFGVNIQTGNIAFLTNLVIDTIESNQLKKLSRGEVIQSFIQTNFYQQKTIQKLEEKEYTKRIESFIDSILDNSERYNPFNLIIGNLRTKRFYSVDIVSKTSIELKKHSLFGIANNWFNHVERNRVQFGIKKLLQNKYKDEESYIKFMQCTNKYEGDIPENQYSIFLPIRHDQKEEEKGSCISTTCLIQQGDKFKYIELSYLHHRKKIREFMLRRKYKFKLAAYLNYLLLLTREKVDNYKVLRKEYEFKL